MNVMINLINEREYILEKRNFDKAIDALITKFHKTLSITDLFNMFQDCVELTSLPILDTIFRGQ